MVETLTELPLTGRSLGRTASPARDGAPRATLPSFVAGPENWLVARTVDRLLTREPTDAPARTSLFALYGPSGAGKTHLASGLVRHWQEHYGAESGQYMTAGDFRREAIAALEAQAMDEFRHRLRNRELLAIDDLDHLTDQRHLQEEFRSTLDAMAESGGTMIVTSSRPAATLVNLRPDIRSRLASGLSLQVALPGTDSRKRIIERAAAALGKTLSQDAADTLAAKISGTATELLGALFEICAAKRSSGAVGEMLTSTDLIPFLAARAIRRPALREIIAVVAKYYRMPQKILKSSSRKQSAVYARATAVYLARELAGASYENIGKALGGRDHTTIMHNYRRMQQDSRQDTATQRALEELRRILLCR